MMEEALVVSAIHSSTEEVFATMLGLDLVKHPSYMEVKAPGPSEGVIAVVGFAGAWIGTASLCCTSTLACRMSSAMLGMEYADVDEEVLDVVSEIANMVVGNFKNAAEPYLGLLGLSIPTVIHGFSFSARSTGKDKWTVIPFSCAEDKFEVKICITPNRGLPHLATNSMSLAHA